MRAQLRDDLMTMLVAGHETTAAVLTWALFCLAQNPGYLAKAGGPWTRAGRDSDATACDDPIRFLVYLHTNFNTGAARPARCALR